MGKGWAKYTVYDKRGDVLLTFKGKGVKKFRSPDARARMGFQMPALADAVASATISLGVDCDCDEDHEEHYRETK